MEYIGNDVGEMDVSITEFGEDEETARTVNYYGVKLDVNTTYHLDSPVSGTTQNPVAYELKDGDRTNVVNYDYDSVLGESSSHTLKVVSGTLVHDGISSTSTEAKKGESITLNAYVPAGYEFVRWNVTSGTGVLLNATEQSTTLIMPEQDVTVEAILHMVDTAVVRADGARTKNGSMVNAKVCCAGSSAVTVYCAFYNEAGKMLSVDIKSADSGENDLSFTTTSGGVATAKLMVLDSQMIPQCDSKAVEII